MGDRVVNPIFCTWGCASFVRTYTNHRPEEIARRRRQCPIPAPCAPSAMPPLWRETKLSFVASADRDVSFRSRNHVETVRAWSEMRSHRGFSHCLSLCSAAFLDYVAGQPNNFGRLLDHLFVTFDTLEHVLTFLHQAIIEGL